MKWRRPEILEPEQGPKIPPEMMARLMAEHRQWLEAEDDRIEAQIRARMGPRRHVSAGDDWPGA